MFGSLKKFRKKIALAVTLKTTEAMVDLSLPLIMAKIIDYGVAEKNLDYVIKNSLLMLALSFFGWSSAIACNYFSVDASQSFGEDLRNRMFTKIQFFTIEQLNRFTQSSLITRVTKDVDGAAMMAMMSMRMILRGLITGIGAVIFAFYINAKLASIFIGILFLTLFLTSKYMKKSIPVYEELRRLLDQVTSIIRENLLGVRVVRALSQEGFEFEKFSDRNHKLARGTAAADNIVDSKTPFMMLLINLGIVGVLWMGGVDVSSGTIKVGEIIALVNYLNMLFFSMGVLNFIFSIWGKTVIAKNRIQEILDERLEEEKNREEIDACSNCENILEFRNIYFSYDSNSQPVLKNINLVVKRGERIGIIGGVGAGKTTLVNLISRLYNPQMGTIFLDGVEIWKFPLGELRKRIGMVFQKSFLFSQSIRENLEWGDEMADLEKIREAASIAQMDEFIESLPENYESKLSKGGVNLSGGQKQRLSIARTILKSSEILIFDDSFSALDYITESRLKERLLEKIKNSTTLTISSKLSTIIDSDRIVLMERGEIVGIGTHEELYRNSELYREICSSQEVGGTR